MTKKKELPEPKKKNKPEPATTETENTTPIVDATPETENVVTIHVVMNGRTIVKTFTIKSEDEIEEKIRRIQRSVKFWGSILAKILVNGNANEKLVKKINKIIGK